MRKLMISLVIYLLWMLLSISAQQPIVDEIISLLNTERQRLNARPLIISESLNLAAQRHSDDMAQGEFLSHEGSDSSEFWQRIADTGYNMTSGAENVLYRNDINVRATFAQWLNSPDHYSNMMNPIYQEVGIAFTRSSSGRVYFTMVLAARADFVMPSPSPTFTPTNIPTQATLPPIPSFTPPPTLLSTSPQAQTTLVPTIVQTAVATDLSTQEIQENVVSQSNAEPIDARIVQQGIAGILVGQVRLGQVNATPTPAPTLIPTATPVPLYDIRLEYSTESFTLINLRDIPMYVEGLYFEGDSGAMDVNRWRTEFLSADLTSFPANGCLQVWGVDIDSVLTPPPTCEVRHAWIAVNDNDDFWRSSTTFDVYRFGELITSCSINIGVCEFNLDERVALPVQSSGGGGTSGNVPVAGSSDLELVYDDESFSLVNTSDADLDLTGLGFASASGIVEINQWNTEFLSRPLSAFPAGDCLQAWSIFAEEWSERPASCSTRHAWIALNDAQLFWTNTDFFTVSRGGVVLATCAVNSGVCTVDLG